MYIFNAFSARDMGIMCLSMASFSTSFAFTLRSISKNNVNTTTYEVAVHLFPLSKLRGWMDCDDDGKRSKRGKNKADIKE